MRVAVVLVLAALPAILVGVSPVLAQTPPPASAPSPSPAQPGLGVVAPEPTPPAPEFGFERGIPPEQEGAREQEFYPERTRSIHQPAFLRGASTTKRTSRTTGTRFGFSGWTAPRIPFDFRESSGGVSFGLSIEWGTPMPEPAEPAPPTQR